MRSEKKAHRFVAFLPLKFKFTCVHVCVVFMWEEGKGLDMSVEVLWSN